MVPLTMLLNKISMELLYDETIIWKVMIVVGTEQLIGWLVGDFVERDDAVDAIVDDAVDSTARDAND